MRSVRRVLAIVLGVMLAADHGSAQVAVGVTPDGVFVLDGNLVFPIGFSEAPPVDTLTPDGRDAYAELASNGAVFNRCRFPNWGPAAEAELTYALDRAAETGLLCGVYIPDLSALADTDTAKAAELARVVAKYKDHPGLGYWKGADEPEWSRVPVDRVQRFYDIVHRIDANHPIWITQAPRGTIDSLRQYNSTYDVGAMDIYPVSYPPGAHSDLPNKNLSVVGDYAARMRQVLQGEKPLWMVLQICWSGVLPSRGKTLRVPTFAEERYMTYQAIINGARGLTYFGGNLTGCLDPRDESLGWNWAFYRKILKPVLRELSPAGPLYPALVAQDSNLPIEVEGAEDVEFLVREAGAFMFLIAAKREGSTVQVRFTGLPDTTADGDLLFESPRKVVVSGGAFRDWFGPNEVHIYRFATK